MQEMQIQDGLGSYLEHSQLLINQFNMSQPGPSTLSQIL